MSVLDSIQQKAFQYTLTTLNLLYLPLAAFLRWISQRVQLDSICVDPRVFPKSHFQYSQGLMTEPVWQAKLRAMEVNLKRCEYPEIYQVRSQLVEDEFKRILDSMPSQCED